MPLQVVTEVVRCVYCLAEKPIEQTHETPGGLVCDDTQGCIAEALRWEARGWESHPALVAVASWGAS